MIFEPSALRTAIDRTLRANGDGIHDPKTDRAAGEDLRLAEMVKRSGATLLIDHAPALIRTRMYQTFGEMWECSTKNWFSGVNFSLPFALYCVFSMYSVSVAPALLALVSAVLIASGVDGQLWWLFIPALLSWLLQMLVMAIVSARSGDVRFMNEVAFSRRDYAPPVLVVRAE